MLYNSFDEMSRGTVTRRIGENITMALTRKMLEAMGIESNKIEQIIEAHTETVDGLKKYKSDSELLAQVQKELNDLKAKGDGGLQKKYDDLKAEYEKYKEDTENAKILAKKKEAFTEVIKDAGLSEKGISKALKYTDWDKIEIGDDNKIKDAKDHIKSLKEEWAEYVVKEGTEGASTSTPPKTGGETKTEHTPSRAADVAKRYYANMYGMAKKETEK